jgi:glycosyltransferase involved in cell wall biosynthesis
MRKFAKEAHSIYIVSPIERRSRMRSSIKVVNNITQILVRIPNYTKTNIFEKALSLILISSLYKRAINKYINNEKFDLILYSTPPITLNSLIVALKQKYNAKTYLILKDIHPQAAVDLGVLSYLNPLYYILRYREKKLYQISDYIGCMSPANVSYILNNNPDIDPSKVEICPNSIELNDNYIFEDISQIRLKYAIPIDKIICIYGGNLGKPQGIDFLMEVLKFNKLRPDVFFLVVGSGTESAKLEKFIKNQSIENAKFIPHVPKHIFDEILYASDIGLIFLNKRFTVPNYPSRLLTYMEFKKPILMAVDKATDIGEIAESNGYGLSVMSGDLDAFCQKLNLLAQNKELRIIMGNRGFKYLTENYTVDKSYEIIISHFKE